MSKVTQSYLDARWRQIVDADRVRFAESGFARTSIADIVGESGLSTGAVYSYFKSKEQLVIAVCEQGNEALPDALTAEAVTGFLEHVRVRARATRPTPGWSRRSTLRRRSPRNSPSSLTPNSQRYARPSRLSSPTTAPVTPSPKPSSHSVSGTAPNSPSVATSTPPRSQQQSWRS